MCQETGLKWVQALPLVLFKIKCTLSKKTGYSPYEFTFSPGDRMWMKDWNVVPQKARWKRPQAMILTTPTAIKVEGIPAWIHHSHAKQL
ncbi:Gag-Pol polyprotein [Plecturocebus cupreus]